VREGIGGAVILVLLLLAHTVQLFA
jgi:hypothetical protein